jgi:pilus assembly protein CpaB
LNRIALMSALVAACIGAALLWLWVRDYQVRAAGGPRVLVVMAIQDIPMGERLTEDRIAYRAIPGDYVEERHIHASDAAHIIGVRVSTAIRASESVLWSDLVTTGERSRTLAGLIRPGMRAVSIQASLQSSFGGLLRPGDRVDALLTTRREGDQQRVTIPLLQNLLVLAVGDDVGEQQERGGRRVLQSVTLGVTVEQAQFLTHSIDAGEVTLILRNPDDIHIIEALPETTLADIVQPARRAQVQRRARPRPEPKEPTRSPERVQ